MFVTLMNLPDCSGTDYWPQARPESLVSKRTVAAPNVGGT